ncbi:MAG: PilZ domain-containing protein [Candidatus Acidiferrales bacterium]|jgi:hypothetical protein
MEKRSNTRYRLVASVVFRWEKTDGGFLQGEGVTRDISVNGAFIHAPSGPPVDVPVKLEVLLPRPQSAGRSVTIVSEAQVIRVECPREPHAREGFAVISAGFAIPGFTH